MNENQTIDQNNIIQNNGELIAKKEQEELQLTKYEIDKEGRLFLLNDSETNYLLEATDNNNSLVIKGLKFTFNKLPSIKYDKKNNIIDLYNSVITNKDFVIDLNSLEARVPTTITNIEIDSYLLLFAVRSSNVFGKNANKINYEIITYYFAIINKNLFGSSEQILKYNIALFEQNPNSLMDSDIIDAFVRLKIQFDY